MTRVLTEPLISSVIGGNVCSEVRYFITWIVTLALNWVLVDSDLGSDGSGFLAQHRKSSQVLNSISFLVKLLVERDIQGEHQRLHFISDWTLQKHTEQNLNN